MYIKACNPCYLWSFHKWFCIDCISATEITDRIFVCYLSQCIVICCVRTDYDPNLMKLTREPCILFIFITSVTKTQLIIFLLYNSYVSYFLFSPLETIESRFYQKKQLYQLLRNKLSLEIFGLESLNQANQSGYKKHKF